MKYASFIDYIKKIKPDYKEDLGGLWVTDKGGGWVSGEYWFRTPLPIAIKTKNKKLKKLVQSHDKTIKLFWISAIIILPAIIVVLNLMN
ncbi:MAG: hypothetical protein N4A45_13235 [Flavobacteriales bacterium]|nr:hypothetical protein [Flavobacteriales bacterium]